MRRSQPVFYKQQSRNSKKKASQWFPYPPYTHFFFLLFDKGEKHIWQFILDFCFAFKQIKKYLELEPLARGKRWILKPCSLDDMEAVKDSFGLLINLLEDRDLEPSRMWRKQEWLLDSIVPVRLAFCWIMVWYWEDYIRACNKYIFCV